MGWSKKCQFWPDLAIQPIQKSIGVSHLSARHHWKPFNLIWAHPEWTDLEIWEISDFWDFQVPRYLKSGLGRAGLGPWVGPWQCCAGAPAARRRAPAQHSHGPTQGPSPARPRPDLRYLGTWKSQKSEISKISRSVHSG